MNRIENIKVTNFKGKDLIDLSFTDLYANKPNLIIAPNGFGKSTIAQAFASIRPTKMELKNDDVYHGTNNNSTEVEITFSGEIDGTYTANLTSNEIGNVCDIKVINNAVVAKSSYNTAGANLKIEPIVIYRTIPLEINANYNFTSIKSSFDCEGKIFTNISDFFEDTDNLVELLNIELFLKRSTDNVRAKNKINQFISSIDANGTANAIKSKITDNSINDLLLDTNINGAFSKISQLSFFSTFTKVDKILSFLQILKWYSCNRVQNDNAFLAKLVKYRQYKDNKKRLDERIKLFNTTGRDIKTVKDGNSLVLKFTNANKMSNGERDVLVFLSELFCFEIGMKKDYGILIIDEVFDYLDGSNLLVSQYYLTKFIEDCKKAGKKVFPLIFTHLDPSFFKNYYFKKPKYHYLIEPPASCINSNIVKIIQNRNCQNNADFASKYLLHYHPDDIAINQDVLQLTQGSFPQTTKEFRDYAYSEVEKYLNGRTFNPILVLVGIRIKVEETAYNLLPADKKSDFLQEHSTINKLEFSKAYDEIPEILYLLQPLYNDSLHLNSNQNNTNNKIKSSCLKLYNNPIKNIIRLLFS